eukprot:UN08904
MVSRFEIFRIVQTFLSALRYECQTPRPDCKDKDSIPICHRKYQ